jgi:hypothetical protein
VKELQYNASGTIEEWNQLKNKHKNSNTGEPFIDQSMIMEYAEKFSQLIFGSSDKISPAIYPGAIDELEKMIKEGWVNTTLSSSFNPTHISMMDAQWTLIDS